MAIFTTLRGEIHNSMYKLQNSMEVDSVVIIAILGMSYINTRMVKTDKCGKNPQSACRKPNYHTTCGKNCHKILCVYVRADSRQDICVYVKFEKIIEFWRSCIPSVLLGSGERESYNCGNRSSDHAVGSAGANRFRARQTPRPPFYPWFLRWNQVVADASLRTW